PAEETLEGARYMKQELERREVPVDKIVMYHTWPELNEGLIGYRKEQFCAGSTGFNAKVTAKGGHAADPDTTADPIYLASNIIQFLQCVAAQINKLDTPVLINAGQIYSSNTNYFIPDECSFCRRMRS